MWWVVSSSPRPHFTPGKDPVPIVQEAGWAPGLVWTGSYFYYYQVIFENKFQWKMTDFFFDVLLTMHLSIFISIFNQLDAQNCCFTISLFHASTCFEHMCSKHVEAWNKLAVKEKFCASSWLITEINRLYLFVVFIWAWLYPFKAPVLVIYLQHSSGKKTLTVYFKHFFHVTILL